MNRGRALALLTGLLLGMALLAAVPVHTLEAKGSHGWIRFKGTGKVVISGRGTFIVKNRSNLMLTFHATWGERQTFADSVRYTHFKGSVESAGPAGILEMRGWDLALSVKGRGKAWFRGEGTYSLDGAPPKKWINDPSKWVKVKFKH
jgi:hypothetical protein